MLGKQCWEGYSKLEKLLNVRKATQSWEGYSKVGKVTQSWEGCSKLERLLKVGKATQSWEGYSKLKGYSKLSQSWEGNWYSKLGRLLKVESNLGRLLKGEKASKLSSLPYMRNCLNNQQFFSLEFH